MTRRDAYNELKNIFTNPLNDERRNDLPKDNDTLGIEWHLNRMENMLDSIDKATDGVDLKLYEGSFDASCHHVRNFFAKNGWV